VPAGVRRCSPDAYRITTSLGMPIEQQMIDTIAIDLRAHRAPCVLERVNVSLAVQRHGQRRWATVPEIEGNPGRRVIGALIAPGQPAQVFWAWMNWCHGHGGIWRTLAEVGDQQVAGAATRSPDGEYPPPDCNRSSSRPSTLTNSYGHIDGPNLGLGPTPLRRLNADASVAKCKGGQLRIPGTASVAGLLGVEVIMIDVVNISRRSCRLAGYPQVRLEQRHGARVLIRTVHGELGPKEPKRVREVTLASDGGRGTFGLSFGDNAPENDCHAFRYVWVKLPGQRRFRPARVAKTNPSGTLDVCGGTLNVSPLGPVSR
jgi:hypothetical protein